MFRLTREREGGFFDTPNHHSGTPTLFHIFFLFPVVDALSCKNKMRHNSLILLLLSLSSSKALSLPRVRNYGTKIFRKSPPPAVDEPADPLQNILRLKGGAVDFATQVAPVLGASIANAMFASGYGEVAEKRKEGKLGDFNPLPMPIIFGNCLGCKNKQNSNFSSRRNTFPLLFHHVIIE